MSSKERKIVTDSKGMSKRSFIIYASNNLSIMFKLHPITRHVLLSNNGYGNTIPSRTSLESHLRKL